MEDWAQLIDQQQPERLEILLLFVAVGWFRLL